MSSKFFAAASITACVFASAPGFAGQYLGGEVGAFAEDSAGTSIVSREQVRSEAARSVQRGEIIGGMVLQQRKSVPTGSPATRAAVRSEAVDAVRHGLIMGGEV